MAPPDDGTPTLADGLAPDEPEVAAPVDSAPDDSPGDGSAEVRRAAETMNVVVKSGSYAEEVYGTWSAGAQEAASAEAAIVGVAATPQHDLTYLGGKTIDRLPYANVYVGAGDARKVIGRKQFDAALAAFLADAGLNDVLAQCFGGAEIEATVRLSTLLEGSSPQTVSRGDVNDLVRGLLAAGKLNGVDFRSSVFNLLLAARTVRAMDDEPASAQASVPADDVEKPPVAGSLAGDWTARIDARRKADSLNGLAGYHGSVPEGGEKVYYAVAVLSTILPDGSENGIVAFHEPSKNIVATFDREPCEVRIESDLEEANATGEGWRLGWTSKQCEEIEDFPLSTDSMLEKAFKEFSLSNGSGKVPIEFAYSNRVAGPEDPTAPGAMSWGTPPGRFGDRRREAARPSSSTLSKRAPPNGDRRWPRQSTSPQTSRALAVWPTARPSSTPGTKP